MAVLRRFARPLLASKFIRDGYAAVRNPVVPAAGGEAVRGAAGAPSRLPLLPEDPVQLVRLQGAVQLGAGLLLALGRAPRSASAALAVTVVSSALTPYLYRATGDSDTDPDPEAGAAERAELLANVSLLGGLLIAAADTHGKPSLAHRTRRVAGHASGAVTHRAGAVSDRVGGAADTAVKSVTASVDAARKRLS
ncbi:DoxX family membrane protein [Streptomyces sp. V2I9]|uniref:DoxX family membrane protein n=1 Tax=Streptomyces sp. V2I9 TaxID=3042304 RepID=UPI0027D81813|nr:DoxX family membrane protein [Streptomyces sp. V2I9]